LFSQVAGVDWEYNGYGGDLYPEWQLDTSNAREAMDHMQIKTQVRVWLLGPEMAKEIWPRRNLS
jgi:agmatine/peptidylarginine deiminase